MENIGPVGFKLNNGRILQFATEIARTTELRRAFTTNWIGTRQTLNADNQMTILLRKTSFTEVTICVSESYGLVMSDALDVAS